MEEDRRKGKTRKKEQERKEKDPAMVITFQLGGLYPHLELLMSNRFETEHLPYWEENYCPLQWTSDSPGMLCV